MKGILSNHDHPMQTIGEGVQRGVLAYNEQLMAVEVRCEKGGTGSEHTHPHTQLSYVLSGKFNYTVEGETVVLEQGDSIVVPAGLVHGSFCLEAGSLLDVFTPMREDFVK